MYCKFGDLYFLIIVRPILIFTFGDSVSIWDILFTLILPYQKYFLIIGPFFMFS